MCERNVNIMRVMYQRYWGFLCCIGLVCPNADSQDHMLSVCLVCFVVYFYKTAGEIALSLHSFQQRKRVLSTKIFALWGISETGEIGFSYVTYNDLQSWEPSTFCHQSMASFLLYLVYLLWLKFNCLVVTLQYQHTSRHH